MSLREGPALHTAAPTLLFYDPTADTLTHADGRPYPPPPVTAACVCHTPPRPAVNRGGAAWLHEDDPAPGWARGATVPAG